MCLKKIVIFITNVPLKEAIVHSLERMIVLRILERELYSEKLVISLSQVQKQAAATAKISVMSIKRIKREALANKVQFSTPVKYFKCPMQRW